MILGLNQIRVAVDTILIDDISCVLVTDVVSGVFEVVLSWNVDLEVLLDGDEAVVERDDLETITRDVEVCR